LSPGMRLIGCLEKRWSRGTCDDRDRRRSEEGPDRHRRRGDPRGAHRGGTRSRHTTGTGVSITFPRRRLSMSCATSSASGL
jgi:hypothetical protein